MLLDQLLLAMGILPAERLDSGDSLLWLVTDFGPAAQAREHVVGAAWVRAGSASEAAAIGRKALKFEANDDDQDYCDKVAVTRAEPTWFEFEATPVLADLQCCGGSAHTADGHTGFCEHHPAPEPSEP